MRNKYEALDEKSSKNHYVHVNKLKFRAYIPNRKTGRKFTRWHDRNVRVVHPEVKWMAAKLDEFFSHTFRKCNLCGHHHKKRGIVL